MKDFLVDIDSEHFENYFQNEIVPYLMSAETERKSANKIAKYLWPIVVPLFSVGFIVGALCEIDAETLLYRFLPEAFVESLIIFSVFALIISILIFCFYNHFYFSKRKSVEDFLYSKLLAYIGDFWREPKGSLFSSKNQIKSLIQDLYLFGQINKFYFFDSIYGHFNGKKIDICEIKLTPYKIIEDILCKEYRGLFVSTQTDLNLSAVVTICKKDSRAKIKLKNDMIPFKTENASFNKLFNVYTTSISDANKILTQDFLKEFLDVYYNLGLSISCSFKNNKLYILILNDAKRYKDWFSFENCKKSYLDKNTYIGLLNDILEVLKVVNTIQRISK